MHHPKYQKKGGDAEREIIGRRKSNFQKRHLRILNTQVPQWEKRRIA
jgi:hypothetical protein